MRKVSGESQARRGGRRNAILPGAGSAYGSPTTRDGPLPAGGRGWLTVAVAVSDAIERLDQREVVVDRLELLPEPLDVAVDRPVVDIDVLAVGGVHQLVAALDVAG